MKRTLVIGDIHGGLKALYQVFEKAKVIPEDKLIFLGDYVDGWSESSGVIDYMIELSNTNECIFIKGNHDVWCEEWLRTGLADKTWLFHGGQETVNSYTTATAEQKMQHLNFLEQMPFYHIDELNRLFIHAGFTSMHGPQKEFHNSNFSWDRTLWETALAMDKRIKKDSILFPKRLKLFSEIYIGHTPTLYYNADTPMQGCNVWNLDTGAAFTGKLSIMDIDTKQFWQSEVVQKLYPGETGRNKN
ncbi:metallophosphoesterase family protein [Ferruginibacter sp. SUN106]|uniref:metallophosphoesterase family protein n=1 Tax=Ferruginibacter sp. SUN106 TaxID=2978348 RepID=UPI003D35FEEA